MDRRSFLYTSLAGSGMLFTPALMPGRSHFPDGGSFPTIPKMHLVVRDNGTYDITLGELVLSRCYPSIDHQPVQPLAVRVSEIKNGYRVTYDLPVNKQLSIAIHTGEHTLRIATHLKGFDSLPYKVDPLSFAEIGGATHFYKQGFGFAGPSGYHPLPSARVRMEGDHLKEQSWSYDSYLATGITARSGESLVMGALQHDRFLHKSTLFNRHYRFGLIDRHLHNDLVFIESGFYTENVEAERGELILPDLVMKSGPSLWIALGAFSNHLARYHDIGSLKKRSYHYCSWYEYKREFNHTILEDHLQGLKNLEPAPRMHAMQIDDGYCTRGEWLETNDHFPEGLESTFRMIEKNGYVPGIWVGPFMVSDRSFIFRDHKDWLLHDATGNLVPEWETAEENTYILDSSHPDAFNYLRVVFRTLRRWGARMFKTDFLDWGYQDSTKVRRYRGGKTSAACFHEVIQMIREEIGSESYWLACISPFQPLVGYADAVRVANDIHTTWSRGSTMNMLREMYYDAYLNGVIWRNDPDVVYMRDYKNELTREEKYTLAYFAAITGGPVNTSDRLHTLDSGQLTMWRFLEPAEQGDHLFFPRWPEFESPLVIGRRYDATGDSALMIINMDERSTKVDFRFSESPDLHGGTLYRWRDFKSEPAGYGNRIQTELKPHESVVYYISKKGAPPPAKLTLGGKMLPADYQI